jgi:hypothetical protein
LVTQLQNGQLATVNAQYRITKKPRIEHVPGMEEWYQKKLQQEHIETEYRYTLP